MGKNILLKFQVFNSYIHPDIAKIAKSIFDSSVVQDLSDFTEKNSYHDSENVLDHIQKVFSNCQEFLTFNFIKSEELRKKYLSYFNQILDLKGKYKRNDLLLLASGLHDIGKGVKLKVADEQGNTKAEGHEHAGADMAPRILAKFDFTPFEISLIQTLIDRHDAFNETFCQNTLTKNIKDDIPIIKQTQPLLYVELVLHVLSDCADAKPYEPWFEYFKNEILQNETFLTSI